MWSESEYLSALLQLSRCRSTELLLDAALAAVVRRTDARFGYVEVEAEPSDDMERRVWRAHDCTAAHVDLIQARISRTIIRKAQVNGALILSANAFEDPRFKDLESVRQYEIGQILCAPFGEALAGVIYLQGRTCAGEFSHSDGADVVLAGRQLQAMLEPRHFAVGRARSAREHGRAAMRDRVVEAVKEHGPNLSALERATGASRSYLRRLLGSRKRGSK